MPAGWMSGVSSAEVPDLPKRRSPVLARKPAKDSPTSSILSFRGLRLRGAPYPPRACSP
jgi:hypothetical protein